MASMRVFGAVRQFSSSASVSGKLVQPPIQLFGTEGRYATALYSAASKEKQLDGVEKELLKFKGLLSTDAKLNEFVNNPSIKRTVKTNAINNALTKQKMSPLAVNFFTAMAENGRMGNANSIIDAFGKLMAAHRGEVVCSVTTAKPLEAAQKKELETVLKSFLAKGESLLLETKVDSDIIGGMIVTIGDKYVDMSMSSKIKTYTGLIQQAV